MKTEVVKPNIEDSEGPKTSNKKFEVMVNVRLPDGSFLWLPVARYTSDGIVAEFDSAKDANDWAEFCLPGKVLVQER